MQTENYKILFEHRMEMRSDLAIVETFQDGSQLIRKHGLMIIVDACAAHLSQLRVKANLTLFSFN